MPSPSAGILLHRLFAGRLEVLLVHPGGPYFARRQFGVWGIPKGEYGSAEDAFAAARREFEEELGSAPPHGPVIDLGEVKLKSGKRVVAWAIAGELDAATAVSNTCQIEWPPRSGRTIEIPEVDEARWFEIDEARRRLNPGQVPLIERLVAALAGVGSVQ
jgi:predicted NUDIX family NTP pyrophosphohydrolase